MATREFVVVGASAGGVEALQALVQRLPPDLPAAVPVVLHVPRSAPSALPRILAFRSAARAFGPRAIGVVLSGSRDDGAAGLAAIARAGGAVVVQDPEDALHPSMPRASLERVAADHVVPAAKIGDLIGELVRTTVDDSMGGDAANTDDLETAMAGMANVFNDITAARQLQDELEHAHRQLETAYEELQSTNEELETTNEELQSPVEELETTNEELQSTNEELETINEELQSTNEELQNINDRLRDSTAELDTANASLEAVLTNLRSGVAVVNRDMQVQVWNRRAEDLWGLRREEVVGQHFLNLDIGLPIEPLRPLIRSALAGEASNQEVNLAAVNRRGRGIRVRVVCSPLAGSHERVEGAIIIMELDHGSDRTGS
jgi:PAS domain S-box-containing protein